jgi:hypothetical protein
MGNGKVCVLIGGASEGLKNNSSVPFILRHTLGKNPYNASAREKTVLSKKPNLRLANVRQIPGKRLRVYSYPRMLPVQRTVRPGDITEFNFTAGDIS